MAYLQRDPTEVIGPRIAAFVIDALLVSGVSVAIFAALKTRSYTNAPAGACQQLRANGYSAPCVQLGAHVYTWGGGRFALALLLSVLTSFVNHVLLQGNTGATLGKMMLGLRVVDGSGRVCGVGRAIVRWLFLIVDQFFCFLVGLIVVLVTHPHRRVGDMVAGTYVVSAADVGRPVESQAAMPPYAYAGQGGWTPSAPGTTWGAPPPAQPTWGTPPSAQPTWGTASPTPSPDQPGWAAPRQPSQTPPPPPPQPPSQQPAPPPSWGAPPPPPAPEPGSEETPRTSESWWDKALGDETKPDEE